MIADLDISVAERLAKLIRLLGSDRNGEVVAAVEAIKRTLKERNLDLHSLADLVIKGEKRDAPTKSDLRTAYNDGYQDGRRTAVDEMSDGWHEVAQFCMIHSKILKDYELSFVKQMLSLTERGRAPSEKQGRWLNSLHARIKEHHNERRRRRDD